MKSFYISLVIFIVLLGHCLANKVILVSLDGFRWDYIDVAKKANRNVSAFEEIAAEGFRAKVKSVFTTVTFPTHFSIATGRYVENHGLYNNKFWDPKLNRYFSMRTTADAMDPVFLNYNKNEPIWITNQRHGKRSCVFYWPGSNNPYAGKYPFATFGLYSDLPTFEYRVDRVMDWITRDEFNFCAFYFNEPDHTAHKYGPNSVEVLDAIEHVNNGIAYLLRRIKEIPELNGKLNLIVTADHGMAEIPRENRIELWQVLKYKQSYFGNNSPGMVGLWPEKGYNATYLYDKITEAIKAGKLKNCLVWLKEDLPERFHLKGSYRMPPVFLLGDTGFLINTNKNQYNGKGALLGNHGYDNDDPLMHPFMVASGPGIQPLQGIQDINQIDIYPFVCGLLGLQRPNMIDGRLQRVTKFMKTPPSEEFMKTFHKYQIGILAEN
uniref:Ectonucleotide pyrophosphatase/phosphodiesterase family member 5 n=1 Tax=Schistocephalus solidus TaxID=70667 RepID=A0A0V0J8Q2_SCHSO